MEITGICILEVSKIEITDKKYSYENTNNTNKK